MMDRQFVEMEEACGMIEEHFGPLGVRKVELAQALGCILAGDVVCREGHPPFSRSAMDGYAVRAADIARPGARLKLAGTVRAGAVPQSPLSAGTCLKVMTGAPIPEGADCVVMQEETDEAGGDVVFKKAAEKGNNIRFRGEDIEPGGIACPAGTLLTPAAIGTCALAGAAEVEIFRRPVVSVVVTGDEVKEPGDPEAPFGFIWNSNGPMLVALLRDMGLEARYLGIAPDDPIRLRASFERGLMGDCLIVTGGVSVGQFDYVPGVIEGLGLEYHFRKVKIKPGKPFNFASGRSGRVFGLPGNPVSALVSFHVFIKPALMKMMGFESPRREYEGRLLERIMRDPERKVIAPCRHELTETGFDIQPVRLNGSADLAGAMKGSCLAFAPPEEGPLERGERVKFMIMEGRG